MTKETHSKYAKLLGISRNFSDVEIIRMLEAGGAEIENRHVKVAQVMPVHTGFGDPFIDLPDKRISGN